MSGYKPRKKTREELNRITDEVVKKILENEHLKIDKIYLYGSYAKGTANEESDIDIMVLCDNSPKEANQFSSEIFQGVDKVAFENDIMIQTNVKNVDFFNDWIDDLPYFRNIKNDGIMLYGK